MGIKKSVRKIDFKTAEEEEVKYRESLSPEQRLKYLQHLREINLGDQAKGPVKRIIRFIDPNTSS